MKLSLFLTAEDKPYVSLLKPFLTPHRFVEYYVQPTTVGSALLSADALLVTNPSVIKQITLKTKCNLQDYQGSLWLRKDVTGKEVPILCLPPLKQIVTTKPGRFLFKHFLKKLFKPEAWPPTTPFEWTLCDDNLAHSNAFEYLSTCDCISIDIETSPSPSSDERGECELLHTISCVGYCGVKFAANGNDYSTRTFVIPHTTEDAWKWIKRINALPTAKIFQNGKYDCFYFLRWNAPPTNFWFDTLEAHHAMFSELPKNLGYISAFYLREISYWKDEGQTGSLSDLYSYNAKDAWATANVFMAWIREAPDWALSNYKIKFPLVFPCLASEVDGLCINVETLKSQKIEQEKKQQNAFSSLRKKIGEENFNPSSPKQVLSLLHILGNKQETSSAEAILQKCADKHPFARLLIDNILEYRESSKLINTYLDATLWYGKLLYSLNPSGTDTGRLASKESSLWCGTQLQNLPSYYKECIEAEEGYFLGEGDNEQSETRCTAYLSGDSNLIRTVESDKDFHAINASAFFGIPYESIVDSSGKVINKTLRDLSKRVNHGANYNMQERVLLATMGTKNVLKAQQLLSLPKKWRPLEVCTHLLRKFDETYPTVRSDFYGSISASVLLTKMLVSQLGWTRLCFGNPRNSKHDLNSYIAHVPSNLSVAIINEAFLEIFKKLHLKSGGAFRLKGQLHDSLLFSYKEGRLDLVEAAYRLMVRPKHIKDCKGKERLMTIPVQMKAEGKTWSNLKKISFQ